jgi:hypothetical protein
VKKILSLSIVVALLGSLILVSPSANAWSNSSNIAVSVWGGQSGDETFSVAVDKNGNIYSTGIFAGTADFDPGAGVTNLTSAGENDIFISKLDPSGNFLWAKRFGDTTGDSGKSIAIDSSGNVLVTGDFTGTVDFDPGIGTANRTSNGGYDYFVLKLDSSGNYLWANSVGGEGSESGIFMAVDRQGNISVTGIFSSVVDFDPGVGVVKLTSSGDLDIFVTKFDSAGNHLWSKGRGGSLNDIGDGIGVDGSGNVYSSGVFGGTVDFDPSEEVVVNLTSAGANDMFISKFDPSGNFLWAKRFGGNFGDGPTPIFIDSSGNIYASGDFFQTVDFYPGEGVFNLTAAGSKDNFISKLDSSGTHIWTKRIGSLGAFAVGARTAVDSNGNVFNTGSFAGTVDFDPGDGIANLATSGFSVTGPDYDIFVSKLDSSGNFLWAKSIGGLGADRGQAIAVDTSGNVYSTGYFSETVDFDPSTRLANFSSAGGRDTYISKFDSSGNAPVVAAVTAGVVANSKVAVIPSGVTEAAIAKTNELPGIKLNFGGSVPTAVTVAPVAVNPAPAAATPFILSPSIKIVDIQLSGSFSGSATVCLDGSVSDRLYHFTNGAWVELGSPSYFNGQVCGVTTSFSPFTAAAPSPIPTAPSSVVATATGKRSATVNFTTSSSNGGSAITSYTATSTPGGITKTLVQATGGTFNFDGLQPSTSYTFDVTATNANGTSAAFTSNSIKTNTSEVASLTSITFTDDGTGTAGKLTWSGKNIDSVLYTGSASSYPGPFNFGAFSSSWNGSIRNLTPETEYTISIYAISVDGIGESKSLTFKTGANLAAPGGSSNSVGTQSTSTQLFQMIIRWVNENTYVKGEATNMTNLLSKFYALETSPHRSYLKVPVSRVSTVTATSLTPKSCSVVSATAKVDAGLVKALTKDTCTISYTVSGPSKAPATLVKDFVFKKVS